MRHAARGTARQRKAEQIIRDNLHLYKLLEQTITDLRAKQTYDTRNPVLGWKIEYKPRINGVVRDGDWYVTSPSKKGYRSPSAPFVMGFVRTCGETHRPTCKFPWVVVCSGRALAISL